LLAELEAAVLLVLRVLLDQEPLAGRVELRVHLDDSPADRQDPGPEIKVLHAEFGQLAPPQAALDVGLDQEPGAIIGKRPVNGVELLGADDLERFPRDGGRLDALAGVQEGHVVQCSGEDRAQDEPHLSECSPG